MSVSNYTSPSTGEPCTGAQYVAEVICQRMATKQKVGTLGYKFWNTKKWASIYVRQVAEAYKLTNEFGDETVVKFINSKKGSFIYSLGMKTIKQMLTDFQKTSSSNELPKIIITTPEELKYERKKLTGSKSLLSRLRGIDG